jgi:hypothetical protein
MPGKTLPRAEVSQRLAESEWQCKFVRDHATHALWRTAFGFYFSVPHDCSEEDFAQIWNDLVRYGKRPNI